MHSPTGQEVRKGMRKNAGTRAVSLMLLAAFLAPLLPAWAVQPMTYDPMAELPTPTKWEKVLEKLGRGFANILFGWAEIPVTFDRKLKEGKSFAYLVGVVPVVGTARAVIRTTVGVYEVVTFPHSSPERNYETILEPEFIF